MLSLLCNLFKCMFLYTLLKYTYGSNTFEKQNINVQNIFRNTRLDDCKVDTIVLDLDKTLVDTTRNIMYKSENYESFCMLNNTHKCFIRPGARDFLKILKKMPVNVHLYTAGHLDYAVEIIRNIDPHICITKIYSRRHCIQNIYGEYLKSIKYISNTNRFLIIDDKKIYEKDENQYVFKITPFSYKNPKFYKDKELFYILRMIQNILKGRITRKEAIKKYKIDKKVYC